MTEANLKDVGDVQIYELGYHILPTVSEEDLSKEVSEIHSLISENGGNFIGEGLPIMRQLSYPISKKIETKSLAFNKAYFGWVKFELERSQIGGIKDKIENAPNILRFLIVKTVRENTMHTPKAPMFNKEVSSRDEKVLEPTDKPEVKEAEIDKSIDELIIN